MVEEKEPIHYVAVGEKLYLEARFHDTFNDALLAHVERLTAGATTPRKLYAAVRSLKTRNNHVLVLSDTLRRLGALKPDLERPVQDGEAVVARFPAA